MTARLYESVTFEPDKLPGITSDTTIHNYMVPSAFALGQADDWQGYLLYKGPCNAVISGSSQMGGPAGSAQTSQLNILIPPFATHMQIGLVASGVGNVGFGAGYTYEVAVNNPAGPQGGSTGAITALSNAFVQWGPGGDNGYTVSNTSGSFVAGTISYSKPADVRIAAFVFVWYRRAADIT